MKTNYSNDNTNSVKHTPFRHSKNSKGMKLLWHPSTKIKKGEYSGMRFGDVLKFFGKKAFPDLLKYYRISYKIMEEYHCTMRPHVEIPEEKVSVPVRTSPAVSKEEEMAKTNVTNQIDRAADRFVALDTTGNLEPDRINWTVSRDKVLKNDESANPQVGTEKRESFEKNYTKNPLSPSNPFIFCYFYYVGFSTGTTRHRL